MTTDIAPFRLIETSPGKFSLLLSIFEPASKVFEAAGSQGGGYSWEAVARHVLEGVGHDLQGRLGLDPESSMFCAYGEDRGKHLARLFHDHDELAKVIETIGPGGFDD